MARRRDDAQASGLDRMALLKVDLEGATARAFAGGREMLGRTDSAVFETSAGSGHGEDGAGGLNAAGLALRRIDGNNILALR